MLLIVGLVLGAVMGVAWWLGQMVDAQDVDEALGYPPALRRRPLTSLLRRRGRLLGRRIGRRRALRHHLVDEAEVAPGRAT